MEGKGDEIFFKIAVTSSLVKPIKQTLFLYRVIIIVYMNTDKS